MNEVKIGEYLYQRDIDGVEVHNSEGAVFFMPAHVLEATAEYFQGFELEPWRSAKEHEVWRIRLPDGSYEYAVVRQESCEFEPYFENGSGRTFQRDHHRIANAERIGVMKHE